MPRFRQLFFERRQRCLGLAQALLPAPAPLLGDAAEIELLLQEIELLGFFLDDFLVAAIWPRSEASCTAAVTTLAVRLIQAASSSKR